MTQSVNSNIPAKKIFNLIKGYFLESDEKFVAWLLLIGIGLCVVSLVAIMLVLTWWSAGFWAILMAKSLTPFLISMGELGLLVGGLVGFFSLKNYLIGKLSICWRNWLSKKMITELFEGVNNYLDLKRCASLIDNFSQRIQDDIKNFVEQTLNLGAIFLKSILSLGAFVGTLWVVGGPLAFVAFGLNIVIPGFLVWAALLVAIVATVVTYFIGKSLPKVTQEVEHVEADFRQDLTQLNTKAENIAEEHAEGYYRSALEKALQRVKDAADEKLKVSTSVTAFQNFYFNLAQFLPSIFAAPLYFAGLIGLGQITQIGMCFAEVSMACSMIVDSFQNIASCRASIERIVQLQCALESNGLPEANEKSLRLKERNKESINIKNLSIRPPQKPEKTETTETTETTKTSTEYLIRNLTLKLIPGEHLLIQGETGIGKSVFFKVLSGKWPYGEGKVAVPLPGKKKFYFLPQEPTLPYGTLKAVLAYPELAAHYTDADCVAALQAVGGMDEFTSKLRVERDWSEISGGQKQRIAFARAILKKPDWLFLDEATSALDEDSEDAVYEAVKKLKGTTMVSIGHRSTIAKHHSRIVFFRVRNQEDKIVEVEERQVRQARDVAL